MKSFRFSREGTLKGLLFFALVGNLSWEPLANHFNQANLASTQEARTLDCTGKDASLCAARTRDERKQSVSESDALQRQVEEAKGKTTAQPNTSSQTEAQAEDSCPKCTQAEKDAKLAQQQKTIAKLTAKLSEKPKTDAATNSDETGDSTTTTEERTRPTADDVRNCKVDTNGDELDDLEALTCQTKRLASLKGRDTSSDRRDIIRQIQDLYTSLRKDARDKLFSKDSDKQREGKETLAAMITILNKARFDKDSDRTKMIDSLEGLKAGAVARQTAMDLQDQATDLQQQFKDSWKEANQLTRDFQNSCRSREGCDRSIYSELQDKYADIDDLKHDHWDLQKDIDDQRESALGDLEDYKDSISRAELRDYIAPFNKLKSTMTDMVDARKNGASTSTADTTVGNDNRFNGSGQAFLDQNGLPTDWYQIRGGDLANRRGNGLPLPPAGINGQPGQNGQVGQQGNIIPVPGMNIGQQPYTPQYMQVPGMGPQQSLLPPPSGVPMNNGMYMPQQGYGGQMMTSGPMMPGQFGGQPQIIPVGQPRPY